MVPARTRSDLLDVNCACYNAQWADAHLIEPQRFNIRPLVRSLLARRIPHTQLKRIPGIGHTPMEAAPEQFLVLLNGARAPVTAARRRLSFASSPMHRAADIRPA